MPLVRLIYSSKKTENTKINVIDDILTIAKKKNRALNITGMLCFNRNYFIQVLEGDREKVCSLYSKISHDKRHSDVVIYQFEEISERQFENWSMGYVPEDKVTSSLLLKYSSGSQFNPNDFASGSMLKMLLSLRENISTFQ